MEVLREERDEEVTFQRGMAERVISEEATSERAASKMDEGAVGEKSALSGGGGREKEDGNGFTIRNAGTNY